MSKIETEKKIIDIENYNVFKHEQHIDNLQKLKIENYVDLVGEIVFNLFEKKTVKVLSWNGSQNKYLVRDNFGDECQYMCLPTKLSRDIFY